MPSLVARTTPVDTISLREGVHDARVQQVTHPARSKASIAATFINSTLQTRAWSTTSHRLVAISLQAVQEQLVHGAARAARQGRT